jgi:hypothetical protein
MLPSWPFASSANMASSSLLPLANRRDLARSDQAPEAVAHPMRQKRSVALWAVSASFAIRATGPARKCIGSQAGAECTCIATTVGLRVDDDDGRGRSYASADSARAVQYLIARARGFLTVAHSRASSEGEFSIFSRISQTCRNDKIAAT